MVSAHIEDSKTHEALPFVNIYVAPGIGTISNAEGDFTINVEENATLHLSSIGYQTLMLKASKAHGTVKMRPMENVLGEVSVVPWENKLVKISKQLYKDFNKNKKCKSQYFYRMTTSYHRKQLVEAFAESSSAVNLRDISFIKGRHGKLTQGELGESFIGNMNLHHPLELGPLTRQTKFWSGAITPFWPDASPEGIRRLYEVTGDELGEDEDSCIYRINLKYKPSRWGNKTAIAGTLYVEKKSLKLLKFEGQLENSIMDITKDFYVSTSIIDVRFTINYRHDRGYTEVASIYNTVRSHDMESQAILYNVEDMELGLTGKDSKKVKENMLQTLEDTGFDQTLWAHSNIVQRTKEEERLAGMPEQTEEVSISRQPETQMERLVERLERFGQSLPQEKVYLHMDNTCYFAGDTIWFSAYTRQTNDNKPSRISGVLYVELFNQDGYLVERKLVEMTNGRGYGNFILNPKAFGGYYELRAYTRWQLNWGLFQREHSQDSEEWFLSKEQEYNHFRDYDKLYSRVFPVYDAPKEEGDYAEIMTPRQMQRQYKRDPHTRKMLLSLYPEGGALVAGLPCRVAYEAAWDDGQALEGELQGVKAETRGRGVVTITPQKGDERQMVFTTKDGKEVKAKLPKPEHQGVALKVDVLDNDSTVAITIHTTPDLAADSLGLTIMREGVMEKFIPFSGSVQEFAIPIEELRTGVNQATVFDAQGRVWADRLFFVRDSTTTASNIQFDGLRDVYEPYEQVQLGITAPAQGGSMSLSIRDAAHRDVLFDNASLLTEMLLTSEIKGFVPNPEWFFVRNDYSHNHALDLLMMTQGWRRFDWQDMAIEGRWGLTQVAERTPVITGKVYDFMEGTYDAYSFQGELYDEESDVTYHVVPQDYKGAWTSPTEKRSDSHMQAYMNELMGSKMTTDAISDLDFKSGETIGKFQNKGLRVHAEVASPDGKEHGVLELDTKDGYFKFQMPRYYGQYVFFLSATDTLAWTKKKKRKFTWIQTISDEDLLLEGHKHRFRVQPTNYPIRVNFPYPRFVKPYDYYQTHLNYLFDPLLAPTAMPDGSLALDEVNVWSRHNSLQMRQDSLPALIVDAYDAYNEALDGGFFSAQWDKIIRNYVDDYGLERPWVVDETGNKDYRIKVRYGANSVARSFFDLSDDPDSAYLPQNLHTFDFVGNMGPVALKEYTHRSLIDKYVIYTDYQPRLSGNDRYKKSNLPWTYVAIFPTHDGSRRPFYRDRRYILSGFSYVNTFYNPDYSQRKPDEKPKDYRRTLYWNPFLRLNAEGKATVSFYNNSTARQIEINAQGYGIKGEMLSGAK